MHPALLILLSAAAQAATAEKAADRLLEYGVLGIVVVLLLVVVAVLHSKNEKLTNKYVDTVVRVTDVLAQHTAAQAEERRERAAERAEMQERVAQAYERGLREGASHADGAESQSGRHPAAHPRRR